LDLIGFKNGCLKTFTYKIKGATRVHIEGCFYFNSWIYPRDAAAYWSMPVALQTYPNLSRKFRVCAVDVIAQPNKSGETRRSMKDEYYVK